MMTPVKQEFLHDPENGIYGDCHRAAFATLLDMKLSEVPHFNHGECREARNDRKVAFLADNELIEINIAFQSPLDDVLQAVEVMNPGLEYILGGESKSGVNHSVIAGRGKIIHDPSLTNSGIVGPCDDGMFWVTYVCRKLN